MKPNMAAITEYRKKVFVFYICFVHVFVAYSFRHSLKKVNFFQKEEAYLDRVSQLDGVTQERDEKRKELEAIRKQRLDEFMSGFSVITAKLKEMYQVRNYANFNCLLKCIFFEKL